jgi:ribonucleoside-diphosphate reductase alpha chain
MTTALTSTTTTRTSTSPTMRVRKRNGSYEPGDVNKIVRAVARCCEGLSFVDPLRVATKTISGLYDGATTAELDRLSIQTAALLTAEEPQYSILAARLLATVVHKEVENQEIHSFSQSIGAGYHAGLISEELAGFVVANARKLNDAIDTSRDDSFEYFGVRTLYDRYLLRKPDTRAVIETPQYFFLRIACGFARSATEALEWYDLFSSLDYLPSSPTLFNAGTTHPQLSSCFLLDSPQDDLAAIYGKYTDVALLSKFSGGIGVSFSRVRSRGSLIRGTNGKSSGIIPFLKTLDASVAAVNQGGKRKGAACVYLETWHADIEEFLELRENTGDDALRTHNLNIANWIPDIFMERVERDESWSLFDPKAVPQFPDLYGEAFVEAYLAAEASGLAVRRIPARDLYAKMMRTLAQTGNGWMCFKDTANRACNQTAKNGAIVHLSNLCTEILEVNSHDQTAVCNLGSVNLRRHVTDGAFDFEKLARTVRLAVLQLDRVIDATIYPIETAARSNRDWRPIGLGIMGLQDAFFQLGLAFDSDVARALSTRISEEIYYHALATSCDLAEANGAHPAFARTRTALGELQFDAWQVTPSNTARWEALRARVRSVGLRNSLLVAIAPTATIASIAGCYECIEPAVSNLFKRETMSGEFLQINKYLVNALKSMNLWNDAIRTRIISADGSIADIEEIPEDVRILFRTAWELPQRALIELAAERGAFIDQSQSLNLFVESPTIGKLSSMYLHAWKRRLKTTYYLRSRPATRITKTTVSNITDQEAVSCSLENPEICEACT